MLEIWQEFGNVPILTVLFNSESDQEVYDCPLGVSWSEGGRARGSWAQASHLDFQHYLQKKINFRA